MVQPLPLFPAITAGLRCGMDQLDETWSSLSRSSRPSRPGSVAAGQRGVSGDGADGALPGHHGRDPLRPELVEFVGRPGTASSRPSRPGSVAAGRTSRGPRTPKSALPGHHGRAPLRHDACHHLRASSWQLFPAITAGLRCGYSREAAVELLLRSSSRPSRPGSVAATLCRTGRWNGTALPGHHGRAPLRPDPRPRSVDHPALFPAITAGLRCGWAGGRRRRPGVGRSSRPSRPGSVAATASGNWSVRSSPPLPGHHGRAPLRLGRWTAPETRCRPLFPAITAGLRCGQLFPSQWGAWSSSSSRPSRPAPLRRRIEVRGARRRRSSSRPSRPGSVAAVPRRCFRGADSPLPGHHGRAPLRSPRRNPADPQPELFPAITAGLRCDR